MDTPAGGTPTACLACFGALGGSEQLRGTDVGCLNIFFGTINVYIIDINFIWKKALRHGKTN